MDDVTVARAVHILAVVHWIGGVALVTAVILPTLRRLGAPSLRLALFTAVEGRFSAQAKVSVTLAGLTGLWMTHRLDAWDRFLDPAAWWMHAMAAVWAVFMVGLFVVEPLLADAWLRRHAARDPDGVLALIWRLHVVLLVSSVVTVAAAVAGAHGQLG